MRVLAKKSDGELFVCGTNSYNPKCRSYRKEPVRVFLQLTVVGRAAGGSRGGKRAGGGAVTRD